MTKQQPFKFQIVKTKITTKNPIARIGATNIMKAFYIKGTILNEPKLTWEELIKASESDPNFKPEVTEIHTELKSIEIPEHLIEKFKEKFQDKSPLQEKEIIEFLEQYKN